MSTIERFLEVIFLVGEQTPSRGVNTYRVLRIIFGIAAFFGMSLTFLLASLGISPNPSSEQFVAELVIISIVLLPSLYIFRWFVVINRRYREARDIEGRSQSKGVTFYIGFISSLLLIFSFVSLFMRNNAIEQNNTEIQLTQNAITAAEIVEQANQTATATLWTPTLTYTPSLTPIPSETPVPSLTLTPSLTPIPSLTPTMTTTPQGLALESGLIFYPVGVLSLEAIEDSQPDFGRYLTILGMMYNNSDSRECLTANDLILVVDGIGYEAIPRVMDEVQDIITPRRDYIGGFLGQCVPSREQDDTFVTFDIPADGNEIILEIDGREQPIDMDWNTIAREINTEIITVRDLEATAVINQAGTSTAESIVQLTEDANATKDANSTATATLWTNTPTITPSITPSPTITPTPTNTLPPTNTPLPTNTPTITPTRPTSTPTQTNTPRPVTYYSTGDANVRSCTQIAQCPVVGAVSRNDEIQVIGTTDGDNFNGSDTWRIIIFEGETAYIHDELVSRTELPDLPTAAPVSVQSQPVNTAVPAANTSNNSNSSSNSGNSSGSQTNTTRPANCTEAVAMGLTAEQAAQWPHLDRDGDGVACYGD